MKNNLTAQRSSKGDLGASLGTALRIYAPARSQCRRDYDAIHYADYHPVVAAKVIGLAFLSALTAWEDFLSEVFLGYMCGYRAPSGYAPKLKTGPSQNRNHAIQVLTGEANHREAERKTRWNSVQWIKAVAAIHFRPGDPFTKMAEPVAQYLGFATVIRNRVAHSSEKAKAQFKDVANKILQRPAGTALERGFSPGQLLIAESSGAFPAPELDLDDHPGWGDNFEGYISLFMEEANRLVPEK